MDLPPPLPPKPPPTLVGLGLALAVTAVAAPLAWGGVSVPGLWFGFPVALGVIVGHLSKGRGTPAARLAVVPGALTFALTSSVCSAVAFNVHLEGTVHVNEAFLGFVTGQVFCSGAWGLLASAAVAGLLAG
jgi:hypothetical protein